MLDVDGSHGEGGGQLLRTAIALSALTHTPVRIHSIRLRRDKPGLAPQHLAAVRAVGGLCAARVSGLALRSGEIVFEPGAVQAHDFTVDVGTAGSITLVLQALLPVMAAAGAGFTVRVAGGTDVRGAPPLDYLRGVLLPLLARVGVRVRLGAVRRGYYPRGGGVVEAMVAPGRLGPLRLESCGKLLQVGGVSHVAHLPAHIADRMRSSAVARLAACGAPVRCESVVIAGPDAMGQGGAIVLWQQFEHTVLGAGRVAEHGIRAEQLGEAVGAEVAADLAIGTTLDVHAADQILVYLALAGGESTFTVRELTAHAATAMWLIEKFLPVRFTTVPSGALVRVIVRPDIREPS